MTTIIHMPQNLKKISARSGTIFVETVVMPAIIVASFAAMEKTLLGVGVVLAWRLICFALRWRVTKLIPATSILTFVMLFSRTLIGISLGLMLSSSTGFKAYMLPACIISFSMGAYFVWTALGKKPIVMKLAEDFIELPPKCVAALTPVFARITFTIGVIHIISGSLGVWIILAQEEKHAAQLASGLAVVTPVTCFALATVAALWTLKQLKLKINMRQPLSELATS